MHNRQFSSLEVLLYNIYLFYHTFLSSNVKCRHRRHKTKQASIWINPFITLCQLIWKIFNVDFQIKMNLNFIYRYYDSEIILYCIFSTWVIVFSNNWHLSCPGPVFVGFASGDIRIEFSKTIIRCFHDDNMATFYDETCLIHSPPITNHGLTKVKLLVV